MTPDDVIDMIGDVIEKIDIMRGSLMPNDPNRHTLDELRARLDDRQRMLSRAIFDEETPTFEEATKKVNEVGTKMQGTLQHIADLNNTIDKLTKFLNAVSGLLALAQPFMSA